MAAPIFPSIEEINGELRVREHDELRRTEAERATEILPVNYAFAPHRVERYGAACDGTTDDTDEIEDALTVAHETLANAQGNHIEIPQGTSVLSSTLNIPNRVAIRGRNKRGSILKASASFSGTYMFTVDDGGSTASMFDNPLDRLTLNCNDVSGLGGVLSDAWQEGGGLRDVLIHNFRTYGVRFQNGDGGATLCGIQDSEIFGSASGASAGIRMDTIGSGAFFKLNMNRCTIAGTAAGGSGELPIGIHVVNGSTHLRTVHFEACTSGIVIDGAGHHILEGLTGASGTSLVTNLVEIASTFTGTLTMIGCFRNGTTNFLRDNRSGGYGTLSGFDMPFLHINTDTLPLVAPGANWSAGVFDGTVGSPTLAAGFNVGSITKNGTGDYTINENRARQSANCAPWATTNSNDAIVRVDIVSTSQYRIRVRIAGVLTDANEIKFGNVRLT